MGSDKKCTKCNRVLPITEFTLDSKRKDKLKPWCKECSIRAWHDYLKVNPTYLDSRKKRLVQYNKDRQSEVRQKAYLIVGRGKLECVCGCGCTDIRFLEINHKNGGGKKHSKIMGKAMHVKIINGDLPIDDLELTCKPYNAGVHALILKYNLNNIPFKITYTG